MSRTCDLKAEGRRFDPGPGHFRGYFGTGSGRYLTLIRCLYPPLVQDIRHLGMHLSSAYVHVLTSGDGRAWPSWFAPIRLDSPLSSMSEATVLRKLCDDTSCDPSDSRTSRYCVPKLSESHSVSADDEKATPAVASPFRRCSESTANRGSGTARSAQPSFVCCRTRPWPLNLHHRRGDRHDPAIQIELLPTQRQHLGPLHIGSREHDDGVTAIFLRAQFGLADWPSTTPALDGRRALPRPSSSGRSCASANSRGDFTASASVSVKVKNHVEVHHGIASSRGPWRSPIWRIRGTLRPT